MLTTVLTMATNDVIDAYGSRAEGLAAILGAAVSADDPDRAVIEPWADTVAGPILDVGSGTGRWSGHLAALGHEVVGLEPVERFVTMARAAHPGVEFRLAELAELADLADSDRAGSDERWAGILAWYSLIHLAPAEMVDALSILRGVLADEGTMLVSFFTGPRLEAFSHPATTAYRWPIDALGAALDEAGFEVVAQRHTAGAMHASVIARPKPKPLD